MCGVYVGQQKRSTVPSSTSSAEQNTAIPVKAIFKEQNVVLNGPRTGRLRKRVLDLDG